MGVAPPTFRLNPISGHIRPNTTKFGTSHYPDIPYNVILNSVWYFDFPVYESSTNQYVVIKLCTNSLRCVTFCPTIQQLFQSGTVYVDACSYCEFFAANICQPRYPRKFREYKIFSYTLAYLLLLWFLFFVEL